MILHGGRDVIRELKRALPVEKALLRTPGGRIYWLWWSGAGGLITIRDESGTSRMMDEEPLELALGDGTFDLRLAKSLAQTKNPGSNPGLRCAGRAKKETTYDSTKNANR